MDNKTLWREKSKSVWQLWRDGITSSFLATFLSCKEQTRLQYVEGWQGSGAPLAMEFGTCIHWILEQLYGKRGSRFQTFDPATFTTAYNGLWRKENPHPASYQIQQQEMVYGMAEAVLLEYLKRWEGDWTGKYGKYPNQTTAPVKWMALEQEFNVPLAMDDEGKKIIRIRGRRDGLFLDKKGKTWLFDTKCMARVEDETILDLLPYNLQFMLYMWATWKELDILPVGIVMNVVRRPQLRQKTTENLKDFLSRIALDVQDPKRYDFYFLRFQLEILKSELVAWEHDVFLPLLKDVVDWWSGRSVHYMNPLALTDKYGRCRLYNILVKGDYTSSFKRTKPFNELTDL